MKLNRTSESRHGDPSALFFTDDGLLLTDNEQELKAKIKFIQRELSKVGLKMNNSESEILVFGKTDKTALEGIRIADHIKNLGVKIENKKHNSKGKEV